MCLYRVGLSVMLPLTDFKRHQSDLMRNSLLWQNQGSKLTFCHICQMWENWENDWPHFFTGHEIVFRVLFLSLWQLDYLVSISFHFKLCSILAIYEVQLAIKFLVLFGTWRVLIWSLLHWISVVSHYLAMGLNRDQAVTFVCFFCEKDSYMSHNLL